MWKLSKQTPAAPATSHPVMSFVILIAAVLGLLAGFSLVPDRASVGMEIAYTGSGCALSRSKLFE